MKRLLLLITFFLSTTILTAQDIQKLLNEIELLKARVEALEQIILSKHASFDTINKTNSSTKRCIAITAAGTQCKRSADQESDYCWQHKTEYKSTKSQSTITNPTTTSTGRTILTGPRGGKYYINSSGKKTYIKKK